MKSVYRSTQIWAEQRSLELRAYDEISSTNDEAKLEASELESEPMLYLAAHQTKGRGRGQNHWLDTGAGESLLSSWSFHLANPPQAITGPRTGEALVRSAAVVWPSMDWSIKPPNDLYLGENKVAGLLVETVTQGPMHRLIIGLGVNVLNHPRTIATATHFTAAGPHQSVNEGEWYQFLDALFNQFKIVAEDVLRSQLSQDVRTHLLKALNAYPANTEPYLDVSASGDLVRASKSTPWSEL